MLKTKPEERCLLSYSGNEPYVFISYAHADFDKVFPMINRLHNDGVRVWYDDGIDPGDDWLEKIARRLENSKYMICFMSPSASNSKYVKGEIRHAISKNIKVLMTYISTVELHGISLITDNEQSINPDGMLSVEEIYSRLLDYANRSNFDIFDYSRVKKALLLNGHSVPSPYLSRKEEHKLLDVFIAKNKTNKLMTLVAHSGGGKSTFLIKHLKDYYSWSNYGNTAYFSFENSPYFGEFLFAFLSKMSSEDFGKLSKEMMVQRVLAYLENKKCTIVFDAVENLFKGFDESSKPILRDGSFLLFIDRLLLQGNVKIVISSKIRLPLFDEYPLREDLIFGKISYEDFGIFMEESGISVNVENEKESLTRILISCNYNVAVMTLLISYTKNFCRSTIRELLNSQFFSIETDLVLESRLFDFYWNQFDESEKDVLKALSLLRGELINNELLVLMEKKRCNKLVLMNKLEIFLLISQSNIGGNKMISLHNVFKMAVSAKICGETDFKNIHLNLSEVFLKDENPFRKAEYCWHILNAGKVSDANTILLEKNQNNPGLIDTLYFLGAYAYCVDLLTLGISLLNKEDDHYYVACKKIAMSLDKSGHPQDSLKYFDEFIEISKRKLCWPAHITGLFYKSEPIYCIGSFKESEELLTLAESKANEFGLSNTNYLTNWYGRKALVVLMSGDGEVAFSFAEKAVKLADELEDSDGDKRVLQCWWNIVCGRTLLKTDLMQAEKYITKAFGYSEEFYDFKAECLYEYARIYLLKNELESYEAYFQKAMDIVGDNIFVFIKLQLLNVFSSLLTNKNQRAVELLSEIGFFITNSDFNFLKIILELLKLQAEFQNNRYEFETEMFFTQKAIADYNIIGNYTKSLQSSHSLLKSLEASVTHNLKELLGVFLCS